MNPTHVLVLLALVVAGWLAAHVAFEWLGRRYLVVSGAEYLLLGVLLGPEVTAIVGSDATASLAPFLTLALGWIGALVGAQFALRQLARLPVRTVRVAFTQSVLTLVAMVVVMAAALVVAGDPLGVPDTIVAAAALGVLAVASAPAGAALASTRAGARPRVLLQAQVSTAVDAFVAIVALGVLACLIHPGDGVTARPPTATEWLAVSVGIGVLGGALFHLFLGDETGTDRLFVGLAGALILVSGAAVYLDLSPLLPAMLVGFTLVNTSGGRGDVGAVLRRIERPLYFVLLLFAGLLWRPPGGAWLLPVTLFVLARIAAKPGAAWLSERIQPAPHIDVPWGLALLGHGGPGLAIALSYRLAEHAPLTDLVFTAGIASILVTDTLSARWAHRVIGAAPTRRAV